MNVKSIFVASLAVLVAVVALIAPHAVAAGQSSANFTIRADSVSAGVANTSSANFSLGSTVGEAAFSAQTNSTNARIDGGFRAQLGANVPVMTLTPTSLNLGSNVVGAATASMNVAVGNQGSATLALSAITITGTNAAEFVRTGTCAPTSTILPAGSCSVTITFTPGGVGARVASLTVTGNDPATPTRTTSLSGTGLSSNPTVTLSVSGAGSIGSSPAGIACPGACSASFTSGSAVVLTANPSPGSILQSFTGCDTTTGLTCTMSPLNVSRNVSAVFVVSAATPPGAPTIGTAIPGNAQATVNFTAPGSDGGSAITGYTATCAPGGIAANGNTSPITVVGLANSVAYNCNVVAINGAGAGPASSNVAVTPIASALTLQQVVSRKLHGGTPYDIDIDRVPVIGGSVTSEPRVIGPGHSIVFLFDASITVAGSVTVRDSSMANVGSASTAASGNGVVVSLTGVPDNKRVTVSIVGVNGSASASVAVGFLVGDVNGTRTVNASDISAVKARSGQSASALNFKFDVNATGAINASDISAVKARSGLSLAP